MAERVYGYELILDLHNCSSETIKSPESLREYADQLCRLIKMKKFGEPLIPHFGTKEPFTKGYSLVQLIETSSITGHFSELWNSAHINIFSCKKYDSDKAADFTKSFFQAGEMVKTLLLRF